MSTPDAPPKTLIPHLVCSPASKAIEFYKKAFDAVEVFRLPSEDGRLMHAALTIDGQPLYLVDDFPEYCGGKSTTATALGGTAVTIHRYVPNCDEAVEKAVKAGATIQMPPTDAFWGDRYAVINDPYGHSWSFAHPLKKMSPEELKAAMDKEMSQHAPA
jgi:PhnB protein